jgi:hypothetical protein
MKSPLLRLSIKPIILLLLSNIFIGELTWQSRTSHSLQSPIKFQLSLMKVSSALQKQATRDLAPIWEVNATVDPFDKLEDVPDGVWPMIIMDDIGFPGAAGIHLDRDGQPFALITAATELDRWALTAPLFRSCKSRGRSILFYGPHNGTSQNPARRISVVDRSSVESFVAGDVSN